MKIVTVIGARPQFIKAAPVSRALRERHHEVLVHTGQHYDAALSDVFFRELAIPAPDYTLQVGSLPHGAQTARMLEGIEVVLQQERPDAVLVYGDTNSTLAGALAAAKRNVPVVHVEAGLRSGVRAMPEEINRILTDRISTICCCPNDAAVRNLAAEGITSGVTVVGDVMLDSLVNAVQRRGGEDQSPNATPYVLATIHRAANTDDHDRLRSIVGALGAITARAARGAVPMRVLWPMHPRTATRLLDARITLPPNVTRIPPLGYLDLARTLAGAACVVTDSGGLQKEAYWLGIPCVTARAETEWTETVASGWNTLVDADAERLLAAVALAQRAPFDTDANAGPTAPRDAYGTVGASDRVADAIDRLLR